MYDRDTANTENRTRISRRRMLGDMLAAGVAVLAGGMLPVPVRAAVHFVSGADSYAEYTAQQTLARKAAIIKVVGVGNGGGNAVQNMIGSHLRGVSFVCTNTDVEALNRNDAPCKIQLGERLTEGLGAEANPVIGREAALESMDAITECLSDADMVFVTAGMGGGTGTGATPILAQVAKKLGTLTVGAVTKPFSFEGLKRKANATAGIAELRRHVDYLITIPNDRLLAFASKEATLAEMLKTADDILYYAVKGLSGVITAERPIGLDCVDVRDVMSAPDSGVRGIHSKIWTVIGKNTL